MNEELQYLQLKITGVLSLHMLYMRLFLQVLTNVVGALGELAGDPECCMVLLRGGGVTTLIQLLRRTSDKLLLNVAHALGSCANDEDALTALLKQDGLRLLWSHLKNPNCRIQAAAANAICTCLQQESVSITNLLNLQNSPMQCCGWPLLSSSVAGKVQEHRASVISKLLSFSGIARLSLKWNGKIIVG